MFESLSVEHPDDALYNPLNGAFIHFSALFWGWYVFQNTQAAVHSDAFEAKGRRNETR